MGEQSLVQFLQATNPALATQLTRERLELAQEIARLRAKVEDYRLQVQATLGYLGRLRHGARPSPTELVAHYQRLRAALESTDD